MVEPEVRLGKGSSENRLFHTDMHLLNLSQRRVSLIQSKAWPIEEAWLGNRILRGKSRKS